MRELRLNSSMLSCIVLNIPAIWFTYEKEIISYDEKKSFYDFTEKIYPFLEEQTVEKIRRRITSNMNRLVKLFDEQGLLIKTEHLNF